MSTTPHDALFKATFSQPEHAEGALRAVLPPALTAKIDFGSLAVCAGSFVDEILADSHSDLLFSARLAGRPALLYVLFEHQSSPDPLMPYRVLKYMVRIWDDHLRTHPGARVLPAIVPIVLHHGESGWTTPRGFHELIDLDAEGLSAIAEHLPRFQLLLDDLALEEDERLHDRAMSALGRLVLLCFKHARDPDELVVRLERWADVVREAWGAPNGMAALALVVRYIFQIGGERTVRVLQALAARQVGKDAEEAIVTYAEQLRQEGQRKGMLEGQRKGRAEMLLELLRDRFGALPETVVTRVQGAEVEQLTAWGKRLLVAAALDDVFAN